ERHLGAEAPLRLQMHVAQVSTLQEETVNNIAAVSELYRLVGGEPVRGVGAKRNSLPSDCAVADDVALIGIAIEIADVPVEKPATGRLNQAGQVGEGRLGTKIQVWQPGKVREIDSRIVGRPPRIADGGNFVFDE